MMKTALILACLALTACGARQSTPQEMIGEYGDGVRMELGTFASLEECESWFDKGGPGAYEAFDVVYCEPTERDLKSEDLR